MIDRTALCEDAWRFHLLADSLDETLEHDAGEVTATTEWFEKMLTEDAHALVDRICAYQLELDARDVVIDTEVERLRAVKERTGARRERSRAMLGQILDRLGVKKIETETHLVARTSGTKKAVPDTDLPSLDFAEERFVRSKWVQDWDKKAILAALKDGETVSGWHLALGEKGVRIT